VRTGDDIRSNIHAGGKLRQATITDTHLRIAEMVRPKLVQDGMFLVGLDIVGDKLMEINVFSPGGLGSAQKFEKVNFAHAVIEALKWFWERTNDPDRLDRLYDVLTPSKKTKKTGILQPSNISVPQKLNAEMRESHKYDLFICHASEDKVSFVRRLAEKLRSEGIEVWYDEFALSLGDSLRRSIDKGLANSRYGVVVLSRNFFKKEWPQKELDGLVAKEYKLDKVILPVWHNITRDEVRTYSPILADRLAASSSQGLDYVVGEIIKVVKKKY